MTPPPSTALGDAEKPSNLLYLGAVVVVGVVVGGAAVVVGAVTAGWVLVTPNVENASVLVVVLAVVDA